MQSIAVSRGVHYERKERRTAGGTQHLSVATEVEDLRLILFITETEEWIRVKPRARHRAMRCATSSLTGKMGIKYRGL